MKYVRRLNLAALALPVAILAWVIFGGALAVPAAHASPSPYPTPAPPCTAAGLNISTGTGNPDPNLHALDPIWTIVSGPTGLGPAAGTPSPLNWVVAPLGTTWVGPGAVFSDPPGDYVYETSFTVPSGMQSFTLDFDFAADNSVIFQLFDPPNGTVYNSTFGIGQTSPFAFQQLWHANQTFSSPIPGTYKVKATVTNDPPVGPNPTGLLVHGTVTCVPAPCTNTLDQNGDTIPDGEDISTGINSIAGNSIPDLPWSVTFAPALVPNLPLAFPVTHPQSPPLPLFLGLSTNWIDPNNSGGAASDPGGTYVYERPFIVPSGSWKLSFNYQFAVDNDVTIDLVPGPPIPPALVGAALGNFNTLHSTVPPTFVVTVSGGTYRLRATVTNNSGAYPGTGNPTGLLVVGTVTCVPAPVGGTVELRADGADPSALAASGSGLSDVTYAALASGLAAGVLALAAGGWYARRRWLS